MVKLLGSLFALTLLLAACSSGSDSSSASGDDGSGGSDSDEPFCDEIEAAGEAEALDLQDPDALAQFQQLVDDAPESIQADMNVFLGVAEQLSEIPEDDIEGFGEAMATIFSPEVIQAALGIQTWGVEECGFDADWFQANSADPTFGDPEFGGEVDLGGGEDGGSGLTINAIEAFLAADYADATWVGSINSWSIGNEQIIEVGGDLTAGEALEACEAITTFALGVNPTATVAVTDESGEVLAANDGAAGSCQAA